MFPPGLSKYHLYAGKKGFDLICMCFSPVSKSADRLRPPHRRLPRRMPESALRCLRTLLAAGGAPAYPQARPVQPIALHEDRTGAGQLLKVPGLRELSDAQSATGLQG